MAPQISVGGNGIHHICGFTNMLDFFVKLVKFGIEHADAVQIKLMILMYSWINTLENVN